LTYFDKIFLSKKEKNDVYADTEHLFFYESTIIVRLAKKISNSAVDSHHYVAVVGEKDKNDARQIQF